MKNLKKLIAVVLTFTLVFSAMAVGFAGTFSDVKDDAPYASAVARLQSLGLVSGMPDGTYQPDGAVTRAQMIAFVNAAEGLQQAAKVAVGPTKFSDVPASYWASGDINIADPSGYPDGTFKPDNTVTYPEALAMLLRALGITENLSWPYGVIAKAADVGLTNGVTLSANATINRGEMAILVNNALDLPLYTYNSDGVAVEKTDSKQNVIKLISKIATPTEYVVLATADQTSDVAAGNVELCDVSGKEVVKSAGNIDFTPYVGEDVNVYFTSTGVPVLVEENTNNVKTYTDATINTTTGAVYDSDGNATNVSLKNIQYILYNGYLTNWSALKTQTLPASFDVKFIDNNGDKTYDYAVVTGYDYASKFVTANVASGAKYIATDNGNYTLVDSNGNAYHYTVTGDVSKLTDIKANDVVYYGKQYDEDGKQVGVYLYVVRQTVSGTVQATYNDGSTNYITINGKDYKNLTGKSFSAGDTVTVALDKDGNALRYLSGSITTTSNYALVLDSAPGSALTAKVQLLLPDGTKTVYGWDNKLNGGNASNITNELVKYEFNSDKTVVQNVYDQSFDDITIDNNVAGSANDKIDTDAKTLTINGTVYYLNDNTVIYNYNSTDDSYSVVKLADINSINGVLKIAHDQYNNVEAVVLKNASYSSTDTSTVVGFVTKAYTVKTSDSSFTRLTAYVNGQSVTYDATKDLGLTITSTSGNAPYTLTVDNNTGKVTDAKPISSSSVVTATVYTSNINTVNMTLKAESASNKQLYYQLAPGFVVVHQNSDSTYSLKYVSDITGNPASVTLYLDANGRVAVIKY